MKIFSLLMRDLLTTRKSILKVQCWGNRVKSNTLSAGSRVTTSKRQVQEKVAIRQEDVNGESTFQKEDRSIAGQKNKLMKSTRARRAVNLKKWE